MHPGPHDTTYGELGRRAAGHALAVTGPVRETYLVSPRDTPAAEEWRTEIGWPVFRVADAGPRPDRARHGPAGTRGRVGRPPPADRTTASDRAGRRAFPVNSGAYVSGPLAHEHGPVAQAERLLAGPGRQLTGVGEGGLAADRDMRRARRASGDQRDGAAVLVTRPPPHPACLQTATDQGGAWPGELPCLRRGVRATAEIWFTNADADADQHAVAHYGETGTVATEWHRGPAGGNVAPDQPETARR
ncbi:hypothetical protein GCM10010240_68140 [Streptomyces griseoviridis]|nr:hypothetical protein GCM10010240_68140 [Streptomyces griseoviridis]